MKKSLLMCAIALCMISPRVFATLTFVTALPGTFGSTSVTSLVEQDSITGLFRYTYTISNATEKYTSFVIGIDPSVSILTSGYSSLVSSWVLTDDGDAMVATITGNLKTSGAVATLWFDCSQSYTTGDGALSNVKSYAQGSVLVPLPEPMTAILLGSGWILLRRYKHKEA